MIGRWSTNELDSKHPSESMILNFEKQAEAGEEGAGFLSMTRLHLCEFTVLEKWTIFTQKLIRPLYIPMHQNIVFGTIENPFEDDVLIQIRGLKTDDNLSIIGQVFQKIRN